MIKKRELRWIMKNRIAELSSSEKSGMGVRATFRLMLDPIFKRAHSVLLFLSREDEPETRTLIHAAQVDGKKVYLPRIKGDKLVCVPYREGDPTKVNEYGIEEPTAKEVSLSEALSIDLAIIPLVAFDKDKHRLGRGKGYYDRYLEFYPGVSVGYAFSLQECECVPTEKHDVKLNYIFTEKGRTL